MIKLKFFCVALIILLGKVVYGQNDQDSLIVQLNLKFDEEPFELNKKYSSTNDSLEVNLFKFYISAIEIQFTDETKFIEINSYHLVDASKQESLRFPIASKPSKSISKIRFCIGVDSTSSVSGALANELDAANGMYWAWQSGYINMKLEGKSSSCSTRKNKFQFHIGGYLAPFYAMQTIEIPVQKFQAQNNTLQLVMDLSLLFDKINLKETNTIMIPCKRAVELAQIYSSTFRIE